MATTTDKVSLIDQIKETIGNGKGEPIEVRVILNDPVYTPTGGPNKGSLSVGIWVDDSKVPEESRLAVNAISKRAKYKNIVFRDVSLMEEVFERTQREDKKGNGYIKIPNSLKPNNTGAYWVNSLPYFLLTEENNEDQE